MATTLIHLHAAAPAKPEAGAACNGCGVCCAWQPCPLGVLISGRRWGACDALRWDDAAQRYHCAMVSDPRALWPQLPAALGRPLQALSRRWIAAGAGCDCDAEVGPDAPANHTAIHTANHTANQPAHNPANQPPD